MNNTIHRRHILNKISVLGKKYLLIVIGHRSPRGTQNTAGYCRCFWLTVIRSYDLVAKDTTHFAFSTQRNQFPTDQGVFPAD